MPERSHSAASGATAVRPGALGETCGLPGGRAQIRKLVVEAVQLAVSVLISHPYRQATVDDLILNVAGTAVGTALWRLVDSRVHRQAVQRCSGDTN